MIAMHALSLHLWTISFGRPTSILMIIQLLSVSHSCLIRCLISCHWFEKWSKFIHIALNVGIDGINDSSHPGPVTSFMLIKFALPNFRPMRLKKNLVEDFDYKLIPEIAWDLLIQWYGISEKSTRLSRYVYKECRASLYDNNIVYVEKL